MVSRLDDEWSALVVRRSKHNELLGAEVILKLVTPEGVSSEKYCVTRLYPSRTRLLVGLVPLVGGIPGVSSSTLVETPQTVKVPKEIFFERSGRTSRFSLQEDVKWHARLDTEHYLIGREFGGAVWRAVVIQHHFVEMLRPFDFLIL